MPASNAYHRLLKALGAGELPSRIVLAGRSYTRAKTLKHDFFAATGLYEDHADRVVLKIGRTAGVLGPLAGWIGRWLTLREAAIYRELAEVPGVPRFLGVWQGATGSSAMMGFVHEFVPGHDLRRDEWVREKFFDQLGALLHELHRRGIAYVDLNKRENILVGDNHRPYLIDFQISYHVRGSPGWLIRRLQSEDLYHFYKHKRRHRPDLCNPEEIRRGSRRSPWIILHRLLTRPLQRLRRRTLQRIDPDRDPTQTIGDG